MLEWYELISDDAVDASGELVHLALMLEMEPVALEQALSDPKWYEAMSEELKAIDKNNTWQLVNLPSNKRPIAVKWVFELKMNPSGQIDIYKVMLVAKGFLQKAGIDFGEVFAPVARMETIRLVVAVARLMNWTFHQMYVKVGILEEEVYVMQPTGFEVKGQKIKFTIIS